MLKKTLPYIKNKYTLTLLAFVVWVSFFDKNDLLSQLELRKEVKKLDTEKKYFVTETFSNPLKISLNFFNDLKPEEQ